MASLDKIAAEEHKRRQRWKKAHEEAMETSSISQSSSKSHSGSSVLSNSIPGNSVLNNSIPNNANVGMVSEEPTAGKMGGGKEEDVLSFSEDSEDDADNGEEFTSGSRDKSLALPFVTGSLEDTSIR